jgi:prepilin-type N-terminal cleavage/methylation domain-containing protein
MKNEEGLTLIELLATLVIFSIVSSLVFGVYMNIQKNYQVQTNQVQLVQDANLIIALIRNHHQKSTSPYSIHYDPTSKITYLEDSTTKQPLGTIPEIVTITFGMNQEYYREDELVDYDPLYLKVTLNKQNGDPFVIDTIISKY